MPLQQFCLKGSRRHVFGTLSVSLNLMSTENKARTRGDDSRDLLSGRQYAYIVFS